MKIYTLQTEVRKHAVFIGVDADRTQNNQHRSQQDQDEVFAWIFSDSGDSQMRQDMAKV